jgi:hypothetical protein
VSARPGATADADMGDAADLHRIGNDGMPRFVDGHPEQRVWREIRGGRRVPRTGAPIGAIRLGSACRPSSTRILLR